MQVNKLLWGLSFLLLSSLACGLSGSGSETVPAAADTEAPSEAAAVASPISEPPDNGANDEPAQANDPEPTPMPVFPDYVETATVHDMAGHELVVAVPARELVPALSAQVESGHLTPEAAAITGLQLLLGDVQVEQIFPDSDVSLAGGFMMMNYAASILNESSDNAAIADIERLFNRLIPTQAMLDSISQPAENARLRAAGGMAMTEPRQTTECTAIWNEGFDEGAAPDCLLYNEFSADGHSYRVYFPSERMSVGAFVPYADAAFEALQRSQEVYSEFAPTRSINVIFVDRELNTERDPSLMALASLPGIYLSDLGGEPCPVMIHPHGLTLPLDEFRQTIAHEIFHCVQLWVKGEFGGDSAVWYIEGMAEYMGNVVYPAVNAEYNFASDWDYNSIDHWIFDMAYDNFVFFQFLGNQFGNAWLIDLLRGLPLHGGKGQQAAHLAGVADMEAIFHLFGQAALSGHIVDSGGGFIPTQALADSDRQFEIESGMSESEEAKPFHVSRYKLTFPEDNTLYTLRLNVEDGSGLNSAQLQGNKDWRALPLELTICEEDTAYLHLLTTTEGTSSSSSYELELGVESTEESNCDKCLIGLWHQPNSELIPKVHAVMAASLGSVSDITGEFFMEIDAAYFTTFTPQNYGFTVTIDEEDIRTEMSGYSTAALNTDMDAGILTAIPGVAEFVITLITPEGDAVHQPLSQSPNTMGALGSGTPLPYVCTDTTLTLTLPPDMVPWSTDVWTRLSEPAK